MFFLLLTLLTGLLPYSRFLLNIDNDIMVIAYGGVFEDNGYDLDVTEVILCDSCTACTNMYYMLVCR
jgi:hypothetical protein